MYINHNKIKKEEEKYVEVKAKVKETREEPTTDKNKIFVEGMLKRMKQDHYT